MKSAHSTSLARDLDALYRVGVVVGLDDRELLGASPRGREPRRNEPSNSIVHRHGPMVLAVCRRAVRDEQAAEDAFQATFLVLAMKAGSIRRQESLGPWLHGVAARIARRARARAARRAWKALDPPCLATVTTESGEAEVEAEELRAVLDEEVERLPASYRRPVVLCYLEGKTQEAAALELGWTKGTVSGRLARAKDLLRARLARKGLAPSAGLTGVFPAGEEARAALPANLARDAVRAGLNAALGRSEMIAASGSVATLAGGFLRNHDAGQTLGHRRRARGADHRRHDTRPDRRGAGASGPCPSRGEASRQPAAIGDAAQDPSAAPPVAPRTCPRTARHDATAARGLHGERRLRTRRPDAGHDRVGWGHPLLGSEDRRDGREARFDRGSRPVAERRVLARRHEAGRRPRRFPRAPGSRHGPGDLPHPGPQGRRARDCVLSRRSHPGRGHRRIRARRPDLRGRHRPVAEGDSASANGWPTAAAR